MSDVWFSEFSKMSGGEPPSPGGSDAGSKAILADCFAKDLMDGRIEFDALPRGCVRFRIPTIDAGDWMEEHP